MLSYLLKSSYWLLWLAAKWERDNLKHMLYMSTVITYFLTPTFRAYLHITNVEVIFIHICVFMILRQMIVEQSDVEIFTNNHINGG